MPCVTLQVFQEADAKLPSDKPEIMKETQRGMNTSELQSAGEGHRFSCVAEAWEEIGKEGGLGRKNPGLQTPPRKTGSRIPSQAERDRDVVPLALKHPAQLLQEVCMFYSGPSCGCPGSCAPPPPPPPLLNRDVNAETLSVSFMGHLADVPSPMSLCITIPVLSEA